MHRFLFHRFLAVAILLFSAVGVAEELEPLKIEPSPILPFPYDGPSPRNMEPSLFRDETPPLVPKGTALISKDKPVTSSCKNVFRGNLAQITDGVRFTKDMSKTTVFLDGGNQWVQIDLLQTYSLYAIKAWRLYEYPTIFFDVIVMISNDPEFNKEKTIIFNNDDNNSAGLGTGSDKNYIDKCYGKLFKASGQKARYVRFYSNTVDYEFGRDETDPLNNKNSFNEIEVYGK